MTHAITLQEEVKIGDIVEARFNRSNVDKVSFFTKVNGKVAFLPDRGFWGIESGDLWQVRVKSANPKGTVYFVVPVRMVQASKDAHCLDGLDYETVKQSRLALAFMRNWKNRISSEPLLREDFVACRHHLKQLDSYLKVESVDIKLKLQIARLIIWSLGLMRASADVYFAGIIWNSTLTVALAAGTLNSRSHHLQVLVSLYDKGFSQYASLPGDAKGKISQAWQEIDALISNEKSALETSAQTYSVKPETDLDQIRISQLELLKNLFVDVA